MCTRTTENLSIATTELVWEVLQLFVNTTFRQKHFGSRGV